jgi:hypothetical protein
MFKAMVRRVKSMTVHKPKEDEDTKSEFILEDFKKELDVPFLKKTLQNLYEQISLFLERSEQFKSHVQNFYASDPTRFQKFGCTPETCHVPDVQAFLSVIETKFCSPLRQYRKEVEDVDLRWKKRERSLDEFSRNREIVETAEAEASKKKKGQPPDLQKLRSQRDVSEREFAAADRQFKKELEHLQARKTNSVKGPFHDLATEFVDWH